MPATAMAHETTTSDGRRETRAQIVCFTVACDEARLDADASLLPTAAGSVARIDVAADSGSVRRRPPATRFVGELFPAQWDPKLGIHVT